MRCFGGSSAALINVVEDNVDEKVRGIIDACSLDRKTAKILSKSVPSIELSKVDIVDLESCHILEGE